MVIISLEKVFNIFAVFKFPCDKQNMITKYKLIPGQMINKKAYMKIIKREYNKLVSLDANA